MALSADLILANRAYADHIQPPGMGDAVAGAGGLVAAVGSAIAPWDGERGTLWIGAGRGPHDHEFVDEQGMEVLDTSIGAILHRRLFFDDSDWSGHYESVANSFLWPALHLVRPNLVARAMFFPAPEVPSDSDWAAYSRVNSAFAAAAAESGRRTAWVHDYQLGLVPALLRARKFAGPIGFFLHTPFPPAALVAAETTAAGVGRFAGFVEGILGSDFAAFQTNRDSNSFCAAAIEFCGATPIPDGLLVDGRRVRIAALPVGVNTDDVRAANHGAPSSEVLQAHRDGLKVVVALERADFTKGIPARLAALEEAYAGGARFAYLGSASPTREGVGLYDGLAQVIEDAAARAAAAAERSGCLFRQDSGALSWEEVVSLLAAADVVFTSSIADGMNLVPLQAAIAQEDRPHRGVVIAGLDAGVALVYSEFEGEGLLVVDPLDIPSMARALARALSGQVSGMSDRFVEAVKGRDASHWAAAFMTALEGAHADH